MCVRVWVGASECVCLCVCGCVCLCVGGCESMGGFSIYMLVIVFVYILTCRRTPAHVGADTHKPIYIIIYIHTYMHI